MNKVLPVVRYLPVLTFEEHGVTAQCFELALTGSGATEDVARVRLQRMVGAFCRALERRGRLEKTLRELGVRWEYTLVPCEQGEDVVGIW